MFKCLISVKQDDLLQLILVFSQSSVHVTYSWLYYHTSIGYEDMIKVTWKSHGGVLVM